MDIGKSVTCPSCPQINFTYHNGCVVHPSLSFMVASVQLRGPYFGVQRHHPPRHS